MSTRYSTVTYQEILDQVLSDIRSPKLANLPTKVVVRHILDAQEQICKWMGIECQADLRLIAGQSDYYFADSTAIAGTGTISSSGAVVTGVGTSFLTQFVAGSKIHAASQTGIVKSVTSDTVCDLLIAPTAIPAGTSFTFDGKASEISTEIRSIKDNTRSEGSFIRAINIMGRGEMSQVKVIEGFPIHTSYDTPYAMTDSRKKGGRYVEFHPAPEADKTISIYGFLVTNPFLHLDDALGDTISLGSEWSMTIRHYLEAMLRSSYLDDEKGEAKSLARFGGDMKQTNKTMRGKTTIKIEYT